MTTEEHLMSQPGVEREALKKIYNSENHTLELSNGTKLEYKLHMPKADTGKQSNLVVFIPGAQHTGEKHLADISQRTTNNFSSVTMEYPKQFDLDAVSMGLSEILKKHGTKKVVLHGSSYGGCLLHHLMEHIDAEQQTNIKGVIYECSPLSRNHLGTIPKRIIGKERVLRVAANMANPPQEVDASASGDATENDQLIDMILQLPNDISTANGNYPRRAINFDRDRLLNTDAITKTLAEESGTSEDEIGITVPSKKSNKLGHEPESWNEVHGISAKLIDEFLN